MPAVEESQGTQQTANEEEEGGETTPPREAIHENCEAVKAVVAATESPSLIPKGGKETSAKEQATTGATTKKARAPSRMPPIVPPDIIIPATATAGTKRRREGGDAALEDSKASGDSEEKVLDIIRVNIEMADRQILHAKITTSSRSNGRRGDDGEDPFSQNLKSKLLSVLSHRMYVDGLTKLAERLNLDCCPTEPNVSKYVATFVANFVKWYINQ